jgi:lipopolysaccharide biosynthesis regulator YciM
LGQAVVARVASAEQLAPAGDDWSLERGASDPALVAQRFTKLRASPFDAAQWRALEAAIGKASLAKKISEALARDPNDLALGILDARARLALGDARAAADRLAALEPRSGGLQPRVLELRVRALQTAGDVAAAIAALEQAAAAARGEARTKLLLDAFARADQAQRSADALRLAQALAAGSPGPAAQLRLARAAAQAGQKPLVDTSYAAAIAGAREAERPGLRTEWARARLQAGDPGGAADLMWTQLATHDAGFDREAGWNLVFEAAQRQAGAEALVTRLERFLAAPQHAGDAAGWRTLARARTAAGLDPVPAWRKALAADPNDPEARAALISALESGGDADAALAEFHQLGAKNPERVQLGLDLAGRLIAGGKRAQGLQVAAEIEAAAGRSGNTLLRLLDFYNLNDEPERALAVAQRLAKAHPRDADARIALGEQLFQMGREPDALKEWAALPGLIRPAHAGWARYAEILSEHHRPEAGLALERALKAAPREPKYLRLRALIEQDERLPQRAFPTWQQIYELTRGPEQRLLHDEARTRMVDHLVGHSYSQFAARRQQLEKQALAELDGAKDPNVALEAGRLLAELYTREEKFGSAVGVHQKLVKLRPQDPERLAELALALRRAGRGDAAMAVMEQLMTLDPRRSADVLSELAELAFDNGDIERVLAAAARSEGAGPEHHRVLLRLGELHERRGDVDQAQRTYEGILAREPKHAQARLRLAELAIGRGQLREAEARLRELLGDGGPPEVLEEAGRRALDLAEASGGTLGLLDLALLRIRREPADEAPRELLLDALDRSDPGEILSWVQDESAPTRQPGLRRALVEALARGPVGARLRAAELLGRLALPQTAVPLARMGAQLTAPRDATRTVREAFEQARAAAIRAAGALDDPEAVAVFGDLLASSERARESWFAAAWSLARSSAPAAIGHLRRFAVPEQEGLTGALTCVALARGGTPGSAGDLPRASRMATSGRESLQRRVCALAEAALTPDDQIARVYERLQADDPTIAAIAAWRLGQLDPNARPREAVAALLRRYVGVPGLARDAAAAALARQLVASPPARGPIPPLPPVRARGWEITVERWLTAVIAPPYQPLDPAALQPFQVELRAALATAQRSSRAEAQAATALQDGADCPSAPADGDAACLDLRPLVRPQVRPQVHPQAAVNPRAGAGRPHAKPRPPR